MNSMLSSSAGIIAAGIFFFTFVLIAYVAFRLLRKTVKTVVRLVIVVVIMAIAIAGSVSLLSLSKGNARPTSTRRK